MMVRKAADSAAYAGDRALGNPHLGSHIDQLLERLHDAGPAIRRIAVRDCLRERDEVAKARLTAVLLARLMGEQAEREDDAKCRLLIIRGLGEQAYVPALGVLAQLRDNPQTPTPEYHAALLAHDAIEVSLRPPPVVTANDEGDAEE